MLQLHPEPTLLDQLFTLARAGLAVFLQVTVLLPIYLSVSVFLTLINMARTLYTRFIQLGGSKLSFLQLQARQLGPIERPAQLNVLITGISGFTHSIAREYVNRARHSDQRLQLTIIGSDTSELERDLSRDLENVELKFKSNVDMKDGNAVRKIIGGIDQDMGRIDIVIVDADETDETRVETRERTDEKDRNVLNANFDAIVNVVYPVIDAFQEDLKRSPQSWKQLAIVSSMSTNYSPIGGIENVAKLAARELGRHLRYRFHKERTNIGVSVVMPLDGSSTGAEMARFISGGSVANIVDGIQHNHEVATASYWIHAITRVFQFIPFELVAAVNEFAMTGSREMMENIGVITDHLKNSSLRIKTIQDKLFKNGADTRSKNDAGNGQIAGIGRKKGKTNKK